MDLSRIARGGTPIQLDKPRLLFFDMAATWLLYQRYKNGYLSALYSVPKMGRGQETVGLVLESAEALAFFLWAGLQADASLKQETLTLEQATDFITPITLPRIFELVIRAVVLGIQTPELPGDREGKEEAAAARPADAAAKVPARKTASTSRKRSASRSQSSAKLRSSSGRKR